jgi:hypothetical protein
MDLFFFLFKEIFEKRILKRSVKLKKKKKNEI